MIFPDTFVVFLGDTFLDLNEKFKNGKTNNDGYVLISFHVPLYVLNTLYERFLREEIEPIEKIEQSLKTKYWNIARKYYHTQELAIKASKAAYVLSLITNT